MKNLRTIIIVLFSLICVGATAQTLDELREEQQRNRNQLDAVNSLLGKNRDNIRLSERDVKLVQTSIETQRKIITSLDREAELITAEINSNTRQVRELDQQLETLRSEYGEFIYSAWKNHKMNTAVAFLFASRDFNDATRRIAHMRRYNEMREKKGAEIDSLNYILQYEIEKLNRQKTELEETKALKNREVSSLAQKEKQHSSSLEALRSDRKKLEAEAKEYQRRIANAQKQIDNLIAQQAKANQANRTVAQKEEDIVLTGKFEDNKGKLPWPVTGGAVLDRFGKHAVSSQRGITNDFKGINIAAPRGSQVRAVFEGEVTGVYRLDHFNIGVTVRSGNYVILYANLARASVKTGDRVAINQEIGALSAEEDAYQHLLIFQIWRETQRPNSRQPELTPLDPEQWLRP